MSGTGASRACFRSPFGCAPPAVRTTAPPCMRTGLLKKQEGGKPAFPALKRAFRLLVEGVDDRAPTDIAFAYSGYAPLLVRCGGPSYSADGPVPRTSPAPCRLLFLATNMCTRQRHCMLYAAAGGGL